MNLTIKHVLYLVILKATLITVLIHFISIDQLIFSNSLPKIKNDVVNISELCSPLNKNYTQFTIEIDGNIYPKLIPNYDNFSINFSCLNNQNLRIKKILLWNTFFGLTQFKFGLGKKTPFIKQNCPVYNCELTNNKSELNDSDIVLVHMRDYIAPFPKFRPNNQRWIFWLYESPMNSGNFHNYESYFNLTSTYRIDSDFPFVYMDHANFRWIKNQTFNLSYDYYAGKTEFAAAIISNCGGSSKRLEYINQLQKYIPVKIFGKCGAPCPGKFKNSKSGNCKDIIAEEFKFYLAFENSICRDYITEKFFYYLKKNIITVVLGGGDYELYAPKSSFINVKDFPNPKKLADYLLYLDNNITAYNSYFKWKQYADFYEKTLTANPICQMCIQLQLESFYGIKKRVINNLNHYWHHNNCRTISPNQSLESFLS